MKVHIHQSLFDAILTMLEFLMAWIPIKFFAAKYEHKSGLAAAVLNVL